MKTNDLIIHERLENFAFENEALRAALKRAHDILDAEHAHSPETWKDREQWTNL